MGSYHYSMNIHQWFFRQSLSETSETISRTRARERSQAPEFPYASRARAREGRQVANLVFRDQYARARAR